MDPLEILGMAFSLCAYKFMKVSTAASWHKLLSLILESSKREGVPAQSGYHVMEAPDPSWDHPSWLPFSEEGIPIDITAASPATAHTLLHLTELYMAASHRLTASMAIRTWVVAKNWPAVNAVCISRSITESTDLPFEVDLSHLGLDSVPEALRGLSCHKLDLSHNNINYLPDWVSDIPNIMLEGNPLQRIPQTLRSWKKTSHVAVLARNHVKTNLHKIVFVGDSGVGKTTLLRCLSEKRKKLTMKHVPTPGISVHKARSLSGKKDGIWTVWDLGDKQTLCPFQTRFFSSKSIFILVFNLLDTADQSGLGKLKIDFWLNEILAAQKQVALNDEESVKNGGNIVLVGTHLNEEEDAHAPMRKLLREKYQGYFRFIFFLNLASNKHGWTQAFDEGWFEIREPITYITKMLEKVSLEETVVPQSWLELNKELQLRTATITWSRFIRIAASCGVGKLQFPQDQEYEMCAHFLADIGTVIHFRHEYLQAPIIATEKRTKSVALQDLVILDPTWLPQIIELVLSPNVIRHYYHNENIALGIDSLQQLVNACNPAVSDLLFKFEVVFFLEAKALFSFFLLPDRLSYHQQRDYGEHLQEFWSAPDPPQLTLNGRVLRFKLFPIESFFKLMRAIMKLEGVVPLLTWKEGMLLGYLPGGTSSSKYQQMLLLTYQEDTVSICMRTIGRSTTTMSNQRRLLACVNQLFSQICTSMFKAGGDSLPVQSFPCPDCLVKFVQRNPVYGDFLISAFINERTRTPVALPPNQPFLFRHSDILESVSNETHKLKCKEDKCDVDLATVAPDFTLGGSIAESEVLTAKTAQITITSNYRVVRSGIWKGREVGLISPYSNSTQDLQSDVSSVTSEISIINTFSGHENVEKAFATHLHPQPCLVMEFPAPQIPRHLSEKIGSLINKPITLGDLISILIEKGSNTSSLLDQVIPASLRKKILDNVAQGLDHLHNQFPPIVHGNLHPGSIIITSLDEHSSGACAKITGFEVAQSLPFGVSGIFSGTPSIAVHAPEVLSKSLFDTKSDIWSFGNLVFRVIDPLTPLFKHLEADPLYTVAEYSSDKTAPGQCTVKLSETRIQSGLIRGLITPAPLPPVQQQKKTKQSTPGTANNTPETPTPTPTSTSPPPPTVKTTIPLWAQQILSCCWALEPSIRPAMPSLLNIWNLVQDP
ncbi:hypothetical protein Pelo_15786 [Pelomyxa schiedti]|nr:hypothetical protein Pelo_15786 [Pelomyxa schiedti]